MLFPNNLSENQFFGQRKTEAKKQEHFGKKRRNNVQEKGRIKREIVRER